MFVHLTHYFPLTSPVTGHFSVKYRSASLLSLAWFSFSIFHRLRSRTGRPNFDALTFPVHLPLSALFLPFFLVLIEVATLPGLLRFQLSVSRFPSRYLSLSLSLSKRLQPSHLLLLVSYGIGVLLPVTFATFLALPVGKSHLLHFLIYPASRREADIVSKVGCHFLPASLLPSTRRFWCYASGHTTSSRHCCWSAWLPLWGHCHEKNRAILLADRHCLPHSDDGHRSQSPFYRISYQ